MAKDIHQAVREVCLWLPESEEVISHGSPNFKVRGKSFAMYVLNHHGDGRTALWLNAPAGAQELYVGAEPRHFFVPPYVGPRGWLGVNLDRGLSWKRIAALVREAYEKVAPATLTATIGRTVEIRSPVKALSASQLDPLRSKRGAALLGRLRKFSLQLPEVREATQFGAPVWKAGKKTFLMARHAEERLLVCCWVGIEQQGLLTGDSRYRIPAYFGHRGWIALDVTRGADWVEVTALILQSYRHFALRRMLQAID
jgi:hypothetical protein